MVLEIKSEWDIPEKCKDCGIKLMTDGKKVWCTKCGKSWTIN